MSMIETTTASQGLPDMLKPSAEIEHDIPIPPRSKWSAVLEKMNEGDSVLLNFSDATAIRAQARFNGIKVVSRTVAPNQMRVWRVKL